MSTLTDAIGHVVEYQEEILGLKQTISTLETEKENLESDVDDARRERDDARADTTDAEKELDRLDNLIKDVLDDLRLLPEVPLSEVEESITAIVEKLSSR